MRWLILFLSLILIVVFVAFSAFDQDSEYIAESMLYRTLRKNNDIAINPDATPPKMLIQVEDEFKTIIERFPESKTARIAYIRLAELYFINKRSDELLATLEEISKKYGDDILLSSEIQFLKANAYVMRKEWEKAQEELLTLQDKYSNTTLGLQAPLYIANYYKEKGKVREAEEALNRAVMFYTDLNEKNRGTSLGYASLSMLIRTYINMKRHQDAGKVIEDVIAEYPKAGTVIQQSPYIDLVFVKELKTPEKAIEIYTLAKERTDNSNIQKFFQKKIQLIKEYKSQN